MITLENVSKSYKKTEALKNFSYNFNEGNAYGILGINGAGKTTLIGCINNNLSYKGKIEYSGLSKWEIGYVPQELAIYPELSVLENLMFFASIYKVNKHEAMHRANMLMEKTGLTEKKNTLAKELSGGMKRKLNLITGLIHNPKLLICDEVCVGIDPISRQEILEHIHELSNEGLTILYTSHYLDEVEFLCNQIIFLHEGKLILEGSTEKLVAAVSETKIGTLGDVFIKVLRKKW